MILDQMIKTYSDYFYVFDYDVERIIEARELK